MTKTNDSYIISKRSFRKAALLGGAGYIVDKFITFFVATSLSFGSSIVSLPKEVSALHLGVDTIKAGLKYANTRIDSLTTTFYRAMHVNAAGQAIQEDTRP